MGAKVNLILDNSNQMLKDYINVSEHCEASGINKGNTANLDWFLDAGEADFIISNDILCYFAINRVNDILSNWISKLAIGGKLILKGIDVEEVARALVFNKINMAQFSELVYGNQEQEWQFKKFGVSTIDIIEHLKKAGLQIVKVLFESHEYYIEAIRN